MNIIKYGLLVATMYLFNGCVGQPSIPKVEEAEVGIYEKNYMSEYENIKKQSENYKPAFKWVQPKNKKEECKVYVSINPNDDKTKKADYSLYWDGECKDGYAIGLGREFSIGKQTYVEAIGEYKGGKNIPQYFYDFNKA